MSQVGVKVLKNRLPEYLRRVKQGEEIVVTERGQPVAIILPLREGVPVETLEARLAMLAARGIVSAGSPGSLPQARPITVGGPAMSRAILAGRR